MAADTRTNAGIDHVSTFRKLTIFEKPGDRVIAIASAGNLATGQAVISHVSERLGERKGEDSLFRTRTMFNVARIVGRTLRGVVDENGPSVRADGGDASATLILGGQIKGRPQRLFLIYAAGNFIEATPETPFLQIGENKYGKPILDRTIRYDMQIDRAVTAALVSFDSSMRSNMSVGPPIQLAIFNAGSLGTDRHVMIPGEDPYFQKLRKSYGEGIVRLFDRLPDPALDQLPPA